MVEVISLRDAYKFWGRSFRNFDECDVFSERSRKLRRLNESPFMTTEDFLETPLRHKMKVNTVCVHTPVNRKILCASRLRKSQQASFSYSFSHLDGPSRTSAVEDDIIEISDDDEEGVDVLMEWEEKAAKSKLQSAKFNGASKKAEMWQNAKSFRNAPNLKGAIPKNVQSKASSKFSGKINKNGSQDDEDEVEIIKETKPPSHSVSVFTTVRPAVVPVSRQICGANSSCKSSMHSKLSSPKNSTLSFTPTEESKKLAINEVASVEDRHLYRSVLQQFTKIPLNLLQTMPIPRNTREAENSLRIIDMRKSKPQRKMSPVQFVDLTMLEDPSSSKYSEAKRDRESEPHTNKDNEVQVVDTHSPYNSLREALKSKEIYFKDYTKSIKEKYERKQKELEQQMKIEEMKIGYSAMKNKQVHVESIERLTKYLKITAVELRVEPEERPEWPQLTPEMEEEIEASLCSKPPNEVLVEAFSLRITRRDMHTLADRNWLNDEVINFYMNLLIERGKQDNYPKVYAFNTFFYPKLMTGGQEALKRWTRKIDIFSYKMIFVPVHLGIHWCMAVVNFHMKDIKYYDSMGSSNDSCLAAMLTYLEDESMDKKKTAYDTTDWKIENVKDIPHQLNGSDCGVFTCMYAEFLAREAKISFTQDDMPYFRKKMVYEIKRTRLLM